MKLKAWVISVGVVNMTTGKTMYDWSIYENEHSGYAFLTAHGSLLFGTKDTFNPNDEVLLIGNDSLRKLHKTTIIDSSSRNKEELLAMLKKHNYDYYPIKAFTPRAKNNRKLGTSYSIKGTDYNNE